MSNSIKQLPHQLREDCIRGLASSQKKLYYNFYGFAMGICLRYACDRDEAKQIVNDGFYKVLTRLDRYDPSKPFLPWLSRIMTNTAIDHYRAELKHPITSDLAELEFKGKENDIQSKLNYDDLIKLVQNLPPGYRTVFNLFAIDGFTHEEISEQLGISVGTSKSNLFKARQKLRSMLDANDNKKEIITTEINTVPNTAIIFNEQFEPKQDRQIFQAGT
ncbi:RNA polymerase sigma factor [Daejeonella sp.]|uniref:RNA polymerase sigma factor n=1 Tax=Daejeonella sp. TaxID=2805397 RepID=UPI0027229D76|nr:sigma-70 family RNA polymerase sigma factor [Daejeonella sp.]MDO8991651.1 sigma-70 family RNA polymerase sigma factor [Daejeonella sp.]MDP2412875.1 sigma-70 family RNA polymerase sigma factor [Daejeonella sp.]